jgi:hypothetical protein
VSGQVDATANESNGSTRHRGSSLTAFWPCWARTKACHLSLFNSATFALHRKTFHRTKRTKDTAIACLGQSSVWRLFWRQSIFRRTRKKAVSTDSILGRLSVLQVIRRWFGLGKESNRGFFSHTNRTPWIVLHHVPAKNGPAASGEESEAAELLGVYRPDYFVSGHIHSFPYATGQS